MKLTASIAAPKEAVKADDTKVSSLLVPGGIVHTASGQMFRVTSRFANAGKVNVRLADLQGKPVQTPENFQPITVATAKLGAWFRFLAYNSDFDKYVKEYIKAAGLPIDPKMNWAKWFQATYYPKLSWLTTESELLDEAIHQVIITAFLQRNVLGKFQNEIKKYPPNVQQLPVEEQVTTYLEKIFKWRISEAKGVIENILRPEQESIDEGWAETESFGHDSSPAHADVGGNRSAIDTEEYATSPEEVYGPAESNADMHRFIQGFGKWLGTKERPETAEKYVQLFQLFWDDLQNGGTGKIGDIADAWKQLTGKGFDSLKVYFSKLLGTKEQEGLIAQYLRGHAGELGEAHPLVSLMNKISPQPAAVGATASLKGLRLAAAEKEAAPSGQAVGLQTPEQNQNDLHNPPGQDGQGGSAIVVDEPGEFQQEQPSESGSGTKRPERHTVPPELPNAKLHLMGSSRFARFAEILAKRVDGTAAEGHVGPDMVPDKLEEHDQEQKAPKSQFLTYTAEKKTAGQWGDKSYDSDQVHDMLDPHRPGSNGFDAPVPEKAVGKLLSEIHNMQTGNPSPEAMQTYVGVVTHLIEHGDYDVPEPYRGRALNLANELLNNEQYINAWQNPEKRKLELQHEIGLLKQASIDKVAGANKEVLKKLQSVFDHVGYSSKQQCYIVKEGYFYTHGRTEDKVAAQVKQLIPDAQILSADNHWNAWPKDSWFEVRFRVAETPTNTDKPIAPTTETINEPEAAMAGTQSEKKSTLKDKIQARKAAREAEKTAAAVKAKYAKLREVATSGPDKVASAFEQIGSALAVVADGVQTLRANLGLVAAPKEADLKTRIAARRSFGTQFRQIADENPEILEGAVQEIMQSLDEIASATEALADNLGISAMPAEQAAPAMEEHVPAEEAEVEEHEAAGGSPDGFITDRDETGKPKAPKKLDIPQAQGSSEQNK